MFKDRFGRRRHNRKKKKKKLLFYPGYTRSHFGLSKAPYTILFIFRSDLRPSDENDLLLAFRTQHNFLMQFFNVILYSMILILFNHIIMHNNVKTNYDRYYMKYNQRLY